MPFDADISGDQINISFGGAQGYEEAVPDGTYGVMIEKAIPGHNTNTGTPQIAITLRLFSPPNYEGVHVMDWWYMTEQSADRLKTNLQVFMKRKLPDDYALKVSELLGLTAKAIIILDERGYNKVTRYLTYQEGDSPVFMGPNTAQEQSGLKI